MQKEFKYAKLIKLSSIIYSALTILFFMLTNIAAGFVAQAAEAGTDLTGGQYFCVRLVGIFVYVELFGYFAILFMVFMYFFRKNQYEKMHREWPASEKFPLWPFLIGLVFFLIFMSLMKAVLA